MASAEDEKRIWVLSNRIRRGMLWTLQESGEPMSPADLSRELGESLPAIAYHARVLRECGALRLVRRIQMRSTIKSLYEPIGEFMADPFVQRMLSDFGQPGASQIEAA